LVRTRRRGRGKGNILLSGFILFRFSSSSSSSSPILTLKSTTASSRSVISAVRVFCFLSREEVEVEVCERKNQCLSLSFSIIINALLRTVSPRVHPRRFRKHGLLELCLLGDDRPVELFLEMRKRKRVERRRRKTSFPSMRLDGNWKTSLSPSHVRRVVLDCDTFPFAVQQEHRPDARGHRRRVGRRAKDLGRDHN